MRNPFASRLAPWPTGVLDPSTRALVVLAHPDDEMAGGGLAQRLPPTSRFVWITDGDGLAEGAGMRRAEYGAARRLESEAAMAAIGVGPERLRFLGNSEVEIYDAFARCAANPSARHEVFEQARVLARQVAAEVLAFRPDAVFTLAWQGAQPVHDLLHVLVRRALDRMPGARLFEMPLFDPWSLVPLRFAPWHPGPIHELRLTPEEAAAKRRMTRCWTSQDAVLRPLTAAITGAGRLAGLAGRRFDLATLLAVEHFAPVPRDRDYVRSPHRLELLDHPLDRYQGRRITHSGSIAPIVQALSN